MHNVSITASSSDIVTAVCTECEKFTRVVAPNLKDLVEVRELLEITQDFKKQHKQCLTNATTVQTQPL